MSYCPQSFPTNLWTWSWHAAEISAILGGYRQGTFSHDKLKERDLASLSKGIELADYFLKEISEQNKKIEIRPLESMIDFGDLLSLNPFSSMQTPSEIKEELLKYKETFQNALEKKPLDMKKLNDAYLFFADLADKGDYEHAKFAYSEE